MLNALINAQLAQLGLLVQVVLLHLLEIIILEPPVHAVQDTMMVEFKFVKNVKKVV